MIDAAERDLMELLPQELRRDLRAFETGADTKMYEWDLDVCVWLLAHRYETKSFFTVDGDSFGPLVRGVRARKFGEKEWHLYTYG